MEPMTIGGTVDVRLAKALSHPLRQRLLVALADGRVASPSELAAELDAGLGDVSYHTKQLHRHGLLELVRTERVRGATKHFYTAAYRVLVEDEAWRSLPIATRRRMAADVLSDIWRDVAAAAETGRFVADDVHLSRTPLSLDRAGWEELSSLLRLVVSEALRLQTETAERGGDAAPSELAVLHFLREPPTP